MSLAAKLLTGMLIFCFPLRVFAWNWQTKITVVVKDQTLEQVCALIEKEYGIHFLYSPGLVNLSEKVSITAYNQRLKKVLEALLCPAHIRFARAGEQIILLPPKKQSITVNGFVRDAVSNENLIGATIYDPITKQGTITNAYGFFSLTLPVDTVNLFISYIGYQSKQLTVTDNQSGILQIQLPLEGNLQEVVVHPSSSPLQEQTQMSKMSLPNTAVKGMPRLLGEVDIMRTLQSLPGVNGGMNGAGGLYVRGGSPDQNLVLIDGSPVFNSSHFFGVFSLLNANVVKTTDLYKGAFPARFGGRLSSIIDIATKEGDMKSFHGDAAIGLISTKFNLEGPIIKDKTSFMISARRSYPDLLIKPMLVQDDGLGRDGDFQAFFYDFNLKVNHIISPKDRIFFSFYKGDDFLLLEDKEESKNTQGSKFQLGWGNTIAAIRWNRVYSPKLFSNVTANYSQYSFFTQFENKYLKIDSVNLSNISGKYNSTMATAGLRIDFDYRPMPAHTIKYGAVATMHYFKPANSSFEDTESPVKPLDTLNKGMRINGVEMSLYAEDEWRMRPNFFANIGVHGSMFVVEGRYYYSLQPRLGLRYLLPGNWAAKAAYTHMNQYIHLLSGSAISLPTDLWVPSTQRVAPMYSHQVTAGIAKTFEEMYELSLEGYFKSMYNMIENNENTTIFNKDVGRWDEHVTVGKGWSYGAEVMWQKKEGNTTGWIGYTLSWSNRRFPGLNDDKTYPFKYDQRHNIELVLVHQLGKNWEVSASWHYNSGTPYTMPVSSYGGIENPSPWEPSTPTTIDKYSEINNFRGRDSHRLDVGITYSKQKKRWLKSWNFSVYNVYNRRNPYFYVMDVDPVSMKRYLNQITILPILPSITYAVKF
ncbi:TonB-dependent receptor [Chitinophaga silvatica]|uniref:TonB-dependent receptor n=1 Tax=Chitinophaga silvatica TaxID=2282649 RepID=A0A3E1YAM7_9BACT|nr:TonB-dependent receptor [Chitinophaga silvatica]RFS22770.1 TonB-dependent receptor [Chitinophaga silvatica]